MYTRAISLLSVRRRAFLYKSGPKGEFFEPSGYLFNEIPLPKGQKRPWDWQVFIYYVTLGGGCALGALGYYFKPDTTMVTWARKEAERQMAEAGEFQDD